MLYLRLPLHFGQARNQPRCSACHFAFAGGFEKAVCEGILAGDAATGGTGCQVHSRLCWPQEYALADLLRILSYTVW